MPNVSVIDSKLAPVSTCLAVRGGGAQAAAAPVYTLHGLSDRSRHPAAGPGPHNGATHLFKYIHAQGSM